MNKSTGKSPARRSPGRASSPAKKVKGKKKVQHFTKMTTSDANLMRGLSWIGALLNARDEATSGRTLTNGERQLLTAAVDLGAVDLGAVEPTTRVTGKKKSKPQTASEALAKLKKKKQRGYGTWNLLILCVQCLEIPAVIPGHHIVQLVQDKINGGCQRYNSGMARANSLRTALAPLMKKHGALIDSLMAHACAEVGCTPLTKKAADGLLTKEWVGALDSRFNVLWDDARAACAALGKPARASTTAASPKKRGADSGGASASPAKKGKKAKTKK